MVEKESMAKGNPLAGKYAVAVFGALVSVLTGVFAIVKAIGMFAGVSASVSIPSPLTVFFPGGSLVGSVAMGLMAVLFGLASFMAFSKITKSPDAGSLVSSTAYRVINTVAISIAAVIGVTLVVNAAAAAVASLLAIQESLDWKEIYLGEFLPSLLVGGGLLTVAYMIHAFSRAKLKATAITGAALAIAALGCVLIFVAVGVKSHTNDAIGLFGIDRQIEFDNNSITNFNN
jgi:hypothetical protein